MYPALALGRASGMAASGGGLCHWRRRDLCGRFDNGHWLGWDDGERCGRRGVRHRGHRLRTRRRQMGVQGDETGHHQGADDDEIFQDKHHSPPGPARPAALI
jgi:hypothetical protein